jgi:hypothetical protein
LILFISNIIRDPADRTLYIRLYFFYKSTRDSYACFFLVLFLAAFQLKSQESAMTVASDLAQVTGSKILYGGDVWQSAELISGLARILGDSGDLTQAREVMSAIVRSTSHLLGKDQSSCWLDLPMEQRGAAVTQLLVSLEDTAFSIAQSMPIDQAEIFAEENLREFFIPAIAANFFPFHIFAWINNKYIW